MRQHTINRWHPMMSRLGVIPGIVLTCLTVGAGSVQPPHIEKRSNFRLFHVLPTEFDCNSIAFSPDSRQILSGGWNELVDSEYDGTRNSYDKHGRLRRWAVQSGHLLQEQATKQPLMAIAYSPDGRLLATGYGGEVRLSASVGGRTLRRIKIDVNSDPTGVEALAFSPDGRTLAAGTVLAEDHSETGPFLLWDVRTGHRYGSEYRGFFAPLARNPHYRQQWFAVAPSAGVLVSHYSDNAGKSGLVVRQEKSGKIFRRMRPGFDSEVLAVSRDGRFVAGLNGNDLNVLDVTTGEQIADVGCDSGMDGGYPQVAISPNGRYVAAAVSHKIYVWRVNFPQRTLAVKP